MRTPWAPGLQPFLRVDALGRRLWPFGWHELWLTGRVTALGGDVVFMDEEPLGNHLRLGFGGRKYTQGVTSLRLEFRYALLRDLFKVSLFHDLAAYRDLDRLTAVDRSELGGAGGLGLHFLIYDEFQLDAYVGGGWTSTGDRRPGFNLQLREAF